MATLNRGNINFSSDDELIEVSSDQESVQAQPWRRGTAAIIGGVALVVCGALAVVFSQQQKARPLTARMLFEHPDVHAVAADNVMKVGDKMMGGIGADKPVRRLVEDTFRHVGSHLPPATREALDNTPITEDQKNAIVHLMSYLSDPRAHMLGIKVAHAVRDADSTDPDVLKVHIAQKLAPYMSELRHLHSEMYPEGSPLRQTVGMGDGAGFEDLLTPKRIKLMKTADDGWDMHFNLDHGMWQEQHERRLQWGASTPAPAPSSIWGASSSSTSSTGSSVWGAPSPSSSWAPAPAASSSGVATSATNGGLKMSKSIVGILGALLTESTSLLRMIRPMAKLFGHDLNVNPIITTALGASDFAFELGACWIDAAADDGNPIEAMMCPMEFGSELMDAGREIFTLMGLLGDNNPANGVQGNHNGQSNVTTGILDSFPE